MVLSLINMMYQLGTKPLKSDKENKIELFNEICILNTSYFMMTFLNVAMTEDIR